MGILVTAEQVGPTSVRYDWSGTAPYDIWLKGELIAWQTTTTHIVVDYYGDGAEPWIEVIDATAVDPAESAVHSPRLRLQWRGQADAALYRIERKTGSTWETKQVLRESGQGYCWFLTTPESNGATAQWRVVAEDERGYESGQVLEQIQTVVCNPATPAVAGTYDADTGDLTIEAA